MQIAVATLFLFKNYLIVNQRFFFFLELKHKIKMALQSIRYTPGQLEILDQLLLPVQSKYVNVKGVEDGWRVINKMQVSGLICILHK